MESLITMYCSYNLWLFVERNSLVHHAEAFIRKTVYIRHIYGIQKKSAVCRLNTDMRRFTTGIRSENCNDRRFRRCAKLYLHKPR
jgi:hypothetical protein